MKRGFDLVVGTVLALAAAPLVMLLALPTALVLRANPFFVQDRVGLNGRLFRVLKLRTLPPQAPAYADKYAIQDVQSPAWCQLLRALHLDELPQLFLVPLGRMSLVGPRPEMAFLHEQMDPRFAGDRVSTRPGCTGLWQVSEACAGLIAETPEYDLYYLRNHSIRLDLWIMWRTFCKVARLAAPVTLEQVPAWVGPVDAYRRPKARSAEAVVADNVGAA